MNLLCYILGHDFTTKSCHCGVQIRSISDSCSRCDIMENEKIIKINLNKRR